MRRRLSSSWTYFYKRIFPAAWIVGFGFFTLLVWRAEFTGQARLSPAPKWISLACWTAGTLFLIWFASRLKDVWLSDGRIIISDYNAEESVPLDQVERVTETRMWNPKMIRLHLRRPVIWGDLIVFIAPIRFTFVFMNHPLVKELRSLVSEARASSAGREGPA